MKHALFLLILSILSSITFASSTICKLEENQTGVKAIAWDSSTLDAKVTDNLNNTHQGKVTLAREHKPYGVRQLSRCLLIQLE